MASKGERRYGKSPKVGKKEESGDTDKSGHMQESSDKAKKTAVSAKPEADQDSDPGPVRSEFAGTEAVPIHERHAKERADMSEAHARARHSLHKLHEKEHSAMADRHMSELSMPETDVGEAGTEPK